MADETLPVETETTESEATAETPEETAPIADSEEVADAAEAEATQAEEAAEVTPEPETEEADTSLLSQGQGQQKVTLNLQKQEGRKGWYVIHTYAGYEDQVAESLQQRIESLGMQEKIFSVIVPKEKQIEIKNGKRRTVEKRIFPGYVMVEMIVTDDSWYVVRNTPNVTGFIGLGVQPTPIGADEVARIQKRMGVEEPKYKIELQIDELVKITDGPLKGFEGKITDVDNDKGKIKVSVSMFGRETPVTLDFLQVKKV
jgi:transcriptional antiterminator NusG